MINSLYLNKMPEIGFAKNKYRILIVDDNAKTRQIHKKVVDTVTKLAFPDDTFEISQAASAVAAKTIIKDTATKPHIYLGDGHINSNYIECPDGPDLAKFAESNGVYKKAIAVISGDTIDAKRITLNHGFEFIEKYSEGKIVNFLIKAIDNLKKIGY